MLQYFSKTHCCVREIIKLLQTSDLQFFFPVGHSKQVVNDSNGAGCEGGAGWRKGGVLWARGAWQREQVGDGQLKSGEGGRCTSILEDSWGSERP